MWTRRARLVERAVLDALAPPFCAACGTPRHALGPGATFAGGLCAVCAGRLEPFGLGASCARCGGPIAAAGGPCPADHRAITGIARRRAAWRYRGTAGALVRRHKFEACPAAYRILVRGMANALGRAVRRPERALLVPVPMHPEKRRSRGRDHAARLADGLADRASAWALPGVLQRLRPTLPQADPRVPSRAVNVAGAFRVARPSRVAGREVVLIDDVSTSGATARECARALREAGALRVVLVVAAVG